VSERSENADYFELCLTTVIIDVGDSLRAFRGDADAYSERVAANVKDLKRALFNYDRSRVPASTSTPYTRITEAGPDLTARADPA
jgi:hypothetical protein